MKMTKYPHTQKNCTKTERMNNIMKLKQLLCGLLAALCVLPLAACGEENPSADTTAADTAITEPAETAPPTDEWGREIIEDSVPADLKYSNEVMRIFTRDDSKYWLLEITAEDGTGDVLNDAVYNRNLTVEERLGVKLEIKRMPGTFAVRTAWFNVLRAAVQADDDSIDMATVYISQGAPLITEGLFMNLLNVEHLDLDKPWWNKSFNEEMTMYDQLYATVGDYMLSMTSMTVATYFNKDLLTEIYPNEKLYQAVYDGKWTLDYLYNLSSTVYSDLNGDGKKDGSDRCKVHGLKKGEVTITARIGSMEATYLLYVGDESVTDAGTSTTAASVTNGLADFDYFSDADKNTLEQYIVDKKSDDAVSYLIGIIGVAVIIALCGLVLSVMFKNGSPKLNLYPGSRRRFNTGGYRGNQRKRLLPDQYYRNNKKY